MENGGIKTSGAYFVVPIQSKVKPMKVFCDMENEGGGWTLFFNYHYIKSRKDTNKDIS